MQAYRLAAVMIAVTFLRGPAKADDSWNRLENALAAIPVVTGGSVWDRMATCQKQVDRQSWFVGKADRDVPGLGIKAGDLLIDVVFDLPRPPGTGTGEADRITYK